MGYRPMPEGNLTNYVGNGRPDPEDEATHLWCNLADFDAMMQQQYPDWHKFVEWMDNRLAAKGWQDDR